jgi:hypothetical protein
MAMELSALNTGRAPQKHSFLLVILISVRSRVNTRAVGLKGLSKLKKSFTSSGFRTRDPPASSAMHQPTTLPNALKINTLEHKQYLFTKYPSLF